jgi:hypothetical protein
MPDPRTCDGCPAVLRGAFDTGEKQWCEDCRNPWTSDDASPFVFAVRHMCGELLELREFLDRREKRTALVDGGIGYGTSASARAIAYAELGIVGTGGRGTKGVGSAHGPSDVADAVYDAHRVLDGQAAPRAAFRLADLVGREIGATLVFVRDHCIGDALYDLQLARDRVVPNITLPQWCGLHMASAERRAVWQMKLITGDGSPALVGANRIGNQLLIHAAMAWCWGAA